MELIERYLFEVGRHLPRQRDDIVSELRSSLEDAVDARAEEMPREEAEVAVLKEMGHPREVAASYYPEGQYLIGPALYPYFRLAVKIAVAALVAVQLLTILASLILTPEPFSILDSFWDVLSGLPVTLGAIVVVFAILQRYGVQPALQEGKWDPRALPPVRAAELANRGELLFELLVNTVVLVWLSRYAYEGGFSATERIPFLQNPIVDSYFPWIALVMVLGIVVDGAILWQGRWQVTTRLAKVAGNLLAIVVLALMMRDHTAWIAARGITDMWVGITKFPEALLTDAQLWGIILFRMIFAGALVVYLGETLMQVYRLAQGYFGADAAPPVGAVNAL